MMKGTPCSSRYRAPLKTLSNTHYRARSGIPAKRVRAWARRRRLVLMVKEPTLTQAEIVTVRKMRCGSPSSPTRNDATSDLKPQVFGSGPSWLASHSRPEAPDQDLLLFLVGHILLRHRPNVFVRSSDQSMPPPSFIMPATCRPSRFSNDADHGTSWKPRPLSIMANRPVVSVRLRR